MEQRFRLQRVHAVRTAVEYWKLRERKDGETLVVFAGHEPREFKALFPVGLVGVSVGLRELWENVACSP